MVCGVVCGVCVWCVVEKVMGGGGGEEGKHISAWCRYT